MAGFQVTTHGRLWVITEATAQAIQLRQLDFFAGWKPHQEFGRRFKSHTTPQNIVNTQTIGR
jgi:hypothetical protein